MVVVFRYNARNVRKAIVGLVNRYDDPVGDRLSSIVGWWRLYILCIRALMPLARPADYKYATAIEAIHRVL